MLTGDPGLPDGCVGHAIMVEGINRTVANSDTDIKTVWVQCSGPVDQSSTYQPMDGYIKQIGGYCELKCTVSGGLLAGTFSRL